MRCLLQSLRRHGIEKQAFALLMERKSSRYQRDGCYKNLLVIKKKPQRGALCQGLVSIVFIVLFFRGLLTIQNCRDRKGIAETFSLLDLEKRFYQGKIKTTKITNLLTNSY